MFKDKMH